MNFEVMKALIITAVAGFIRGFLTEDIRTLQNMGYEVSCAANANNIGADNINTYFDQLGVNFYQIDFDSKKPISKGSWRSYYQLRKLFSNEKFDVVHCHTPIAGCITRIAAMRYRRLGMKVLYTSHGFYFHKGSSKKTWLIYHTIENIMSYFSDAIITINYEDYRCAQKMHCKHVYHINGVGVDMERFAHVQIDRDVYRASIGVKPDDIMLLAAGELTERKNHQVIIKALAELNDKRIIFVLCGRAMRGVGTYEKLKKMAADYDVRLKFLGFRNDMPQICHCADIGVLPSIREGLGMVGLQILASGTPLVTSNVHGIVDYMEEGKTGFMASPYDSHMFAEGIRKLTNIAVRNSMRQNCVDVAYKFSKDISKKQMMDIYEQMLCNHTNVEKTVSNSKTF